MTLEDMLNEEIKAEINDLKNIEFGTETYKVAVDGLTKLVDRSIELEKIGIECQSNAESKDFENNIKLKQMSDDRKDRFVKNCIAIGGIIIPTVVTIWGTIKSIEFEKEGTITTIMGRGFINKLLPKK